MVCSLWVEIWESMKVIKVVVHFIYPKSSLYTFSYMYSWPNLLSPWAPFSCSSSLQLWSQGPLLICFPLLFSFPLFSYFSSVNLHHPKSPSSLALVFFLFLTGLTTLIEILSNTTWGGSELGVVRLQASNDWPNPEARVWGHMSGNLSCGQVSNYSHASSPHVRIKSYAFKCLSALPQLHFVWTSILYFIYSCSFIILISFSSIFSKHCPRHPRI